MAPKPSNRRARGLRVIVEPATLDQGDQQPAGQNGGLAGDVDRMVDDAVLQSWATIDNTSLSTSRESAKWSAITCQHTSAPTKAALIQTHLDRTATRLSVVRVSWITCRISNALRDTHALLCVTLGVSVVPIAIIRHPQPVILSSSFWFEFETSFMNKMIQGRLVAVFKDSGLSIMTSHYT